MGKQILIIDGQGGMLGKQLVEAVRRKVPEAEITAIGTNSIATSNMLKAGAQQGATGENAVLVAVRHADIIAGPVGMVIADSLLGEITPVMAEAIGRSDALKLLLPVNRCNNVVVGAGGHTTSELIGEAVERIQEYCG
ncbi:MAG: DUF3842 family protein [Firmicutes bacterium]|nr:DUF3842 family protein [Bacillota bacterium]MDD7602040.1 DUF3842 family protein [Bacillota bacterium]MDY5856033.1 DUF3842 family protein [Anaerovoracaceae bacterium]